MTSDRYPTTAERGESRPSESSLTLTFQRTTRVSGCDRRCVAVVGAQVVAEVWLSDEVSDGRMVQRLLEQFRTAFVL